MGSGKALLIITVAMTVVVVGTLLPTTASAANYMVGDDSGWDLDVDYDAWARGKNFKVGDTLEFLYSSEATHNVVTVDAQNYKACTVPSNAPPPLTSGDDVVTLGSAGHYFFICSVEGHCKSGMKLAVNVN